LRKRQQPQELGLHIIKIRIKITTGEGLLDFLDRLIHQLKNATSLGKLQLVTGYLRRGKIKIRMMLVILIEHLGVFGVLKVQDAALERGVDEQGDDCYEEEGPFLGNGHDSIVDVCLLS
jgi:hypothetical protein